MLFLDLHVVVVRHGVSVLYCSDAVCHTHLKQNLFDQGGLAAPTMSYQRNVANFITGINFHVIPPYRSFVCNIL